MNMLSIKTIVLGIYISLKLYSSKTVLTTDSNIEKIVTNSGATLYKAYNTTLKDLTICLRFYAFQIPSSAYIFSSWQGDKKAGLLPFALEYYYSDTDLQYWYSFKNRWDSFDVDWSPSQWNHFCLSYENKTSQFKIVNNGYIIKNEVHQYMKENPSAIPGNFLKNLVLMRNYRPYGDTDYYSLFGMITDVNIWNNAWKIDKMKNWTLCRDDDLGNILNWDMAEWSLFGLKNVEMNKSIICKSHKPGISLFQRKLNFEKTLKFCQLMGGNVAVAKNQKNAENMIELTEKSGKEWLYTGLTDLNEEGIYKDIVTEKEMTWSQWKNGEPTASTDLNCVQFYNAKMEVLSCEDQLYPLCHLNKVPQFNLRGACKNEGLDLRYTLLLNNVSSGMHNIMGWVTSKISWQENQSRWNIENLKTGKVVAYTNSTDDYPLGVQKWYFTGGLCKDLGRKKFRSMNLNSCEEHEFSCEDGQCVDLDQRCDRSFNCQDFSDEKNCAPIKVSNYNKKRPQPIQVQSKTKSDTKTKINISIDIQNIMDINEIESKYEMNMEVTISWIDGRLTFVSLNSDTTKNLVESSKIWKPEIQFLNTKIPIKSNVEESDVTVTTLKQSRGIFNDNDEFSKKELYPGKYNTLVKKSKILGRFYCPFSNIQLYPFDNEACTIDISMTSEQYDFTELIPSNFTYQGSEDVFTYIILNANKFTKKVFNENKNGVQVEILFSRKVFSIFLVTYLPTILINIINQATVYFEGTSLAGDIIKVNMTGMMVLSALYISVSKSLPPTSSIKIVEIWLIFSLIYPFLIILFHTIYKTVEAQETKLIILKLILRKFMPCFGLLFFLIYFSVCLSPLI